MKKLYVPIIFIMPIIIGFGSFSYASTITLEIKDSNVTKGAVWYGYFANYPQTPYWHYETSPSFQAAYYLNPITYRAFAEFDLQPWFDLGEDASHILSVSVTISYTGHANVPFNVYAMLSPSYEDGGIGTPQYNSSAAFLGTASTASDGNTLLTSTFTITNYVFDDIYYNPNGWTGIMMRLDTEGTPHKIVNFGNPVLTIETDLPEEAEAPPVPEPASIILVSSAVIGLIRRILTKRILS